MNGVNQESIPCTSLNVLTESSESIGCSTNQETTNPEYSIVQSDELPMTGELVTDGDEFTKALDRAGITDDLLAENLHDILVDAMKTITV